MPTFFPKRGAWRGARRGSRERLGSSRLPLRAVTPAAPFPVRRVSVGAVRHISSLRWWRRLIKAGAPAPPPLLSPTPATFTHEHRLHLACMPGATQVHGLKPLLQPASTLHGLVPRQLSPLTGSSAARLELHLFLPPSCSSCLRGGGGGRPPSAAPFCLRPEGAGSSRRSRLRGGDASLSLLLRFRSAEPPRARDGLPCLRSALEQHHTRPFNPTHEAIPLACKLSVHAC